MADYTPTTDQVRDHWGAGGASEEGFDRWLAAHDAEVAAQVLLDFADATRFPSDWILFRRDDGSGVTVSDLLRERAAAIREGAGQ